MSLALLSAAVLAPAITAVFGDTVYPVSSAPIKNGVVLIRDGKIAEVGPRSQIRIPAGAKRISAPVVTPGLIDARTTLGLTGIYNDDGHDQDMLERSAPLQPELRAIDAYNPQEALISYVRSLGVTAVHTGHAPGPLISGQTCVVKLRGNRVEDAVLVPEAMVAAALGPGTAGGSGAPGNRSKQLSMLRDQFQRVRESLAKPPGDRSLRTEVLARVLKRETPLLVYANRAQDIANALRLQSEFGFRMILDGGAEAYLMIAELKAANVPVLVHAPMTRGFGERENQTWELAKRLSDAGIAIAIQTGYESYVPKVRIVLFEAAIAAANGLGMEAALKAITLDAATILGLESRLGSLAPGKDADIALYDGDPFEYTTRCLGTLIDGLLVSDRQK
jgi:imidazolonepropionase-like amidohydrolase